MKLKVNEDKADYMCIDTMGRGDIIVQNYNRFEKVERFESPLTMRLPRELKAESNPHTDAYTH